MHRHLTSLAGVLTAAAAMSVLPLAGSAQAAGPATPAYPYKVDATQHADPWGFTKRQCTSFAAWRVAQHGVKMSNATQRWGNAADWDNAARRLHYGIGSKPVVGAVAQWNPGERSDTWAFSSSRRIGWMRAGSVGHVAVVRNVHSDGTVVVEQFNMGSKVRSFSTIRTKAPRYLYIGVTAPR